MREFQHRIRELRKEKDLTGPWLAKILGISPQYYYNIEHGKRTLSAELAVRLADYFSVSLDYLLCRSDDPTWHIAPRPAMRPKPKKADLALLSQAEEAAVKAFLEMYRKKMFEKD